MTMNRELCKKHTYLNIKSTCRNYRDFKLCSLFVYENKVLKLGKKSDNGEVN